MKYYIITYGCQMNKSDSERLAAQMSKKRYQPAENLARADLVIINACAVRQSAVDRIYGKIRRLRQTQPWSKIFLTGCLLPFDKKRLQEQAEDIWPAADLFLRPKRQSCKKAFLPIMNGCNNFCSYCAVPHTRGREKSRPAKEIIQEAKELIRKGCQEITLLGQNVNSYQPPRQKQKNSFPALLQKISQLEGNFTVTFLTSHPKDMSDKLIKAIAQNKKISKEIHLPVQSGDDQILKKMNRGYKVEDYEKLIRKIKKDIPQAKISTDIIVGFPGETKLQFKNTLKLGRKIGFSKIYAACYSPRPNTVAAKLKDDVPMIEKKSRKEAILALIKK